MPVARRLRRRDALQAALSACVPAPFLCVFRWLRARICRHAHARLRVSRASACRQRLSGRPSPSPPPQGITQGIARILRLSAPVSCGCPHPLRASIPTPLRASIPTPLRTDISRSAAAPATGHVEQRPGSPSPPPASRPAGLRCSPSQQEARAQRPPCLAEHPRDPREGPGRPFAGEPSRASPPRSCAVAGARGDSCGLAGAAGNAGRGSPGPEAEQGGVPGRQGSRSPPQAGPKGGGGRPGAGYGAAGGRGVEERRGGDVRGAGEAGLKGGPGASGRAGAGDAMDGLAQNILSAAAEVTHTLTHTHTRTHTHTHTHSICVYYGEKAGGTGVMSRRWLMQDR